MYFAYRKKTGEVITYSQNHLDFSSSSIRVVEVVLSKTEEEKIRKGYILRMKDGILELEEPQIIKDIKLQEQRKQEYLIDIQAIQEARSMEDLKPLLVKMAKKNYYQ